MSRFTFILNPSAGKGAGRRLRDRIYKVIKSKTSDFELIETKGQGDATEIARGSSSSIVIAIGGDGTVHEVANGIIGTEKTLGVVPVGSGNDFIKSVQVPKGLSESVECIFRRNVKAIDVGRVEVQNGTEGRSNSLISFFVNGLGIGFDAAVAERTHHISYASGTLLYLIAVLQTLGRYKSPKFSIAVDGRRTDSKNLLIAVGNGICAGGGFYLTPDAKVDDGVLDICLIEEISTLGILRLMPSVMRGNHQRQSCVRFEKGKSITVNVSRPTCVHSDGEILGTEIDNLHIDLVPRALNVIVA